MAKKYIDADRLRAEMEKRMHICDGVFERNSDTYYQGKAVAYQETISFIDTLQQEQPSEGLEEAAEEFVYDWAGLSPTERRIAERAYLAGAEWMAKRLKK